MRPMSKVLAVCAIFIPTTVSSSHQDLNHPTVTIDSGAITGRVTHVPDPESVVNQFLGIPFAQPPVGDLRFSPPQKPQPWTEPKYTIYQPPACNQDLGNETTGSEFSNVLFNTPPPPFESENCLYLNVYAPSGGDRDKPVLFWIYGGSYKAGAISNPIYDGTSFAANQDIIVVAANYRTNIFGFPRSPQLPLDEQNLGQLDQRLALDWVQRNIHAFGGDPKKVTIAGHSAGAVSVGQLISTLPDDPPFRGAIFQSGSSVVRVDPGPPNNDTTAWTALVEHLNCADTSDTGILACARAASVTTLRDILLRTGLSFEAPVADNVTTLEFPAAAYASGNVSKVPILIGSTYNDGTTFTYGAGDNVTQFLASLPLPAEVAEALVKLYAPGSPATAGLSTGNQIISQIVTDSTFRCPSGFVANLTSKTLDVPVWQYMFNDTSALHPRYPELGVYHVSDVYFVFGTYHLLNLKPTHGLYMQKHWANFIKDPQKGPGWKAYPSVGVLGADEYRPVITEEVRDLDPICAEWDKLYALVLGPGL